MTAEVLVEAASHSGCLVEERGASAALVNYGIEPAGAIKVAWTLAHGDEDDAATLLRGALWGLAIARTLEANRETA
jgi:hypothetical protein